MDILDSKSVILLTIFATLLHGSRGTGPPKITQISNNQTVNEGVSLSLSCIANATPIATITWTRLSDNSVVTMPLNISKQSEGGYRCTANNSIGTPATGDVFITVQCPPKITQISNNQTVNEGVSLSLSCIANATPIATITWTRLSDNSVFTMPLSISKQSEGGYRCTANNSIGTPATGDVFITVQYKPSGVTISTNATQNPVIQGESVILTCHVREAKPPVTEYKFYRNGSFLTPATNVNNLVIRGVRRSQHFGEYKCEARNNAGSGQSGAVILNINVPAEIQSLTRNLTVNEGSAIELRCDVTGYPSPTITWRKDGQPKNPGSGLFRIPNSTRSDSGAYVCTADNEVRNKAEKETFVTVFYAATITNISSSVSKSWRGQTVRLGCVSDGVPTPTLSWYTPGGTRFNPVTGKENTVNVTMNSDEDFGLYNCTADNEFAPVSRTVRVQQIKTPGSPNITTTNDDIEATSLAVKWTAPTDDGGSSITGYRVVILHGGAEKKNENITDPITRRLQIGELQNDTNYTVKVFARNFVFEGEAGQRIIKTKFEGVPAAAEILGLPEETSNTQITLKWNEPENNGKPIKNYIVYQRTMKEDGTPRTWNRISVITDLSDLQVTVRLEKGKIYEFVVTATNEFGESLKEENKRKKITVVGGVPSAVKLKVEQKDDKAILTWEKPDGNGAAITKYSVHHRVANTKEWEKLTEIPAGSPLRYDFEGEKGKEYEFVVTASNRYGESPKAGIKSFKVSAGESTPPGSPAGRIGTAVIAGAGAAGALLILGLILFVVWWKLRKTSSDQGSSAHTAERGPNPDEYDDGYEAVGAASAARLLQACGPATDVTYAQPDMSQTDSWRQTYATPISGDYMPLNPRTRSWEVMREQVDIIKVIGKGAFSQVAQATVKNARGYQEYITVAVKMLKANAPASDRKDLLSELDLMKRLKPHPHVIKLIGCVTESDPLLVLIEYVPFGDLLGYLRNSRGLNDKYYKDPDAKPQSNLTAEQLMKFAWQIADGMCYLSSKKIIHRDLAARNVLVGEGEVCKVTDFGMARNVQEDDIYSRKSWGRLPVKWTAYEALLYGTYTTQSDVWSYGVLLYEILTIGGSPYPTVEAREIAEKIQEGYRMPKPRHVDEKLYEIMLRCWEENPFDRPTFEKLRKAMKDMERNHRTYVNLIQYDDRLYANINDFADD